MSEPPRFFPTTWTFEARAGGAVFVIIEFAGQRLALGIDAREAPGIARRLEAAALEACERAALREDINPAWGLGEGGVDAKDDAEERWRREIDRRQLTEEASRPEPPVAVPETRPNEAVPVEPEALERREAPAPGVRDAIPPVADDE